MSNNLTVKVHLSEVSVINEGKDNEFVSIRGACNEYQGKDADGNKREHTEWFSAVAFKGSGDFFNMAERVKKANLKKGDYIELQGPWRMRPRTDGEKTYQNWNIILDKFTILNRKNDEETATPDKQDEPSAKKKPAVKKAAAKPESKSSKKVVEKEETTDIQDDIPFG